jgi:hypothetical protein
VIKEEIMRFSFTTERYVREWLCWEIEAATFEEACQKFRRLREEGEPGEVVDRDSVEEDVSDIEDETGTSYDINEAYDLIWPE